MNKSSAKIERRGQRLDASSAIHASALVLGEAGVLIRGPSGSGKSSLTLALLALAGERGLFAALIGDDRVLIGASGERILASGAPNVRGLIERRGYGIVRAPTEPCAVVRLVVDLSPRGERGPRLPDEGALTVSLGEIALPRLAFDPTSAAVERAYAVLEYLDRVDDKIVSGIAHFA
jgi:serine kinase of HPr protein (carbohydrate metabolism regulator)